MLAIIYDKSGTHYASPVFAIKYSGWSSEVLAFNKQFTQLKRFKLYSSDKIGSVRRVFIVEWAEFSFGRGRWKGYDWVVNDKKLFSATRFARQASVEDFPQFRQYAHAYELPEYFSIDDKNDITSFMEASFGLHDSLINSVARTGDDITIDFNTTWGCFITAKFIGVKESREVEDIGQIYESRLDFTDGGIKFTVTACDGGVPGNIVDYEKELAGPYILCDKIHWRIRFPEERFSAVHSNNTPIESLYKDLKTDIPEAVTLENNMVNVRSGDDVISFEIYKGGVRVYYNGVKQRRYIEEQDVYDFAVDFAARLSDDDILWKHSPRKACILADAFKKAVIPVALWLCLWLILLSTKVISGIGFAFISGIPCAIMLILPFFSLTDSGYLYIATSDFVAKYYPRYGGYDQFVRFERCQMPQLNHNRFNYDCGSIVFRSNNSNKSFRIKCVKNVDKAYNDLVALWAAKQAK